MANDIQLKRSSVAGRVPDAANVLVGEPVVNLTDKIIFTKDGGGNVIVIGSGTTSNVTEGSNLYFSNARVSTAISTQTLGNATFSSDVNVRGELYITGASGDEGGQINLAPAVTNSTLSGQVVIDVYQNRLRFFEKGGTNRGAYIDLSTGGAAASTSLISTGSGTITSVAGVSSGAVSNAQLVTATVTSQTLTNATFSANVTADRFISNNNGNSENYRVGDDIWIGDYNAANSMKLKGAQDSTQAYISFGASGSETLGRSGLGALTYTAGFAASNIVTTGNVTAGNVTISSGGVLTFPDGSRQTTAASGSVTAVNGRTGAVTGLAETANGLSQFASTTSSQLAGVISDETGTGNLVFSTSPTLVTPVIGAATGTSLSVTGNIVVSSGNSTGNGLVLSDDGDFVDMNDGYGSLRFTSGIKVKGGKYSATDAITLASTGTLTATGNVNSNNELVTGSLTAGTLQTAGNVNTGNLRVVTNSSVGTVVSGTWNGSSISTTYTDAKIVSVSNTAPISATTAAGAVTVGLLNSGVVAGTYGSASAEGVFTVDAYGRITSASNVTSSVAIGTQVTGLGTNVANFLAYPTSANLISVVTNETGSGSLVFATTPTLVTPILGLATGTSVMLSANIGAAAGNVSGNFTAGNFQTSGNVNAASALFTGAVTAGSFQTTGLITGNINLRVEASDYAKIYSDVNGPTSNLVIDISDDVNADAIVLRHTSYAGGLSPIVLDMAAFKRKDNTNATIAFAGDLSVTANVSTANIIATSTSRLGTVTAGTWNGSSISTTYTDAKVTSVNGQTGAATGFATTANSLSQFASTTSAQLAGIISDETGTGSLVFATTPTLVTPVLGLATGTSVMLSANVGAAAGNVSGNFTAGNFQTAGNVNAGSLLVANGATLSGNVNITGNLNVTGAVTTYTSNTVEIADTILYLATGNSGDVQDIGFVGHFTNPGYQHTGLVRDASDGIWKLFANVATEPSSNTLDFTTATYSALTMGALSASTGTFSGTIAATSSNVNVSAGLATGNFTAANFQSTGNVNTASALFTGSATAGTLQTSGNVNANNLRVVTNSSVGTVVSGTWNGTTIGTAYGGTGLTSLGTGIATFLGSTPTSANLATLITDETGSGSLVFATAPTLVTPVLGLATGTSVMLSANIGAAAGNVSGNFTAANFQSTGNVNTASALFTGSATAGTLQTSGNVNANNLRVVTNSSVGTVVSGTWNGSSISTTYTDAKVTSVNGQTGAATGFATTANTLAQFASTTSAQLATLISDETGSGSLVFATTPTLVTPVLGLATGTSVMLSANIGAASGNVSGNFTAGNFQSSGNVRAVNASFTGNVGVGTTTPAYKLEVSGSFAATTKSFVIDHPTKPGRKLRYGSLEGPENGVYVRGSIKGYNVIELPDYWIKLIDPDSITVQLTPIGRHQKIFVENIIDNTVIIGNDGLFAGEINCFYTIFAERVDVDKLKVEI